MIDRSPQKMTDLCSTQIHSKVVEIPEDFAFNLTNTYACVEVCAEILPKVDLCAKIQKTDFTLDYASLLCN